MNRMTAAALAAALACGGCAGLKPWQRWGSEEQARYFGLTWVAPDSVVEAYRGLPSRAARDSCYSGYWGSMDPSGQAGQAHHARLEQARRQFGGDTFFEDERSAYWVRMGKPDLQLAYYSQPHALEGHRLVGATITREQPWEIWEYHSLGLAVDFVQRGEHFQAVSAMAMDRRHPVAFFRPDTAGPRAMELGGTLSDSLPLSWANFKSSKPGKVRLELYWWLPLEALRGANFTAVVQVNGESGWRLEDTMAYRLDRPEGALPEPYAFGQLNYDLPPGQVRASVALLDREGGTCYRAAAEDELLDYRPGIQEASDVELAVLQDTTFIGTQFQKGPYRRVIPLPGATLAKFQPFFVYYEVYHLTVAPDGRHWLRVKHRIFSSDDQGRIKECLINTEPVESRERGDTYRGCHKVHLLSYDLPPGEYYLAIDAEDVVTGRTSRLSARFELDAEGGRGRRRRKDPGEPPPRIKEAPAGKGWRSGRAADNRGNRG